MPHGPSVNIFYEQYRERESYDRKNNIEDLLLVKCPVAYEFLNKVYQVLNDHCSKSDQETYYYTKNQKQLPVSDLPVTPDNELTNQ
jgi:hypothetical protein